MREHERYPARWPSSKQAKLVGCMLAGFALVGVSGALLGWNPSAWDFSTVFGGIGGGAIYWMTQVML